MTLKKIIESTDSKAIQVVLVPVDAPPEVRVINNSLKTLQDFVQDRIEFVYGVFEDISAEVMVGEESKLERRFPNFWIFDRQDVVCGPALLTARPNEKGEMQSLPDSECEKLITQLETMRVKLHELPGVVQALKQMYEEG